MAVTVFCLVPRNAKKGDLCKNPLCHWPMGNHYLFGKPRTVRDEQEYQHILKYWEAMEKRHEEYRLQQEAKR